MRVEILTIGTEILLGDIINTNSQYLSREMMLLGFDVYRHTTVGDNPERMKEAMTRALNESDLILATGGLGPTNDDLTKEIAMEILGQVGQVHEPSLRRLESYFKNPHAIEANMKQSIFPPTATVLDNDYGTAPGCILHADNGKRIVLLPGPPNEMKHIYESRLRPILEVEANSILVSRNVLTVGLGEWAMAEKVSDITQSQINPSVAPYAKPDGAYLRVTAKAKTRAEANSMIDQTIVHLNARLGDAIYGYDEDTLEKDILDRLIKKNASLSMAESITGGMVTSRLIDIPGASQVISESYVTYSDDAKHKTLNVSYETLEKHSAVSEQVCTEMLKGLRKLTKSDYCIATTGYAGPTGDRVGLVYIGVLCDEGIEIKKFQFNGDRERIRSRATRSALGLLREMLLR